jgi:hypothetical protein
MPKKLQSSYSIPYFKGQGVQSHDRGPYDSVISRLLPLEDGINPPRHHQHKNLSSTLIDDEKNLIKI